MTPTSTAWPTKTAGQISVHAIPLPYPMTSRTQPSQQGPPLTFSYGIPNALRPEGVCPREALSQVGKECSCRNPPMNALPSMCCLPIPIPAYSSEDSGNAVTASTPTPGPGQSLCYQVQYMFCPDSTKPELEVESEAELSTPGSFNDVRGDSRCCECCRSPQGRKGLRKSKVNKRTIKEEMERPQRFTASNTSIQVEHLKLICESLGRALAVAATAAVDAAASKYAPSPTTSAPNSPPNYSAKSSLLQMAQLKQLSDLFSKQMIPFKPKQTQFLEQTSREVKSGQTNETIEVSEIDYKSNTQQRIGEIHETDISKTQPVMGSDSFSKQVASIEPKNKTLIWKCRRHICIMIGDRSGILKDWKDFIQKY